jgi:hypothetical protein
VKKPHRRRKPTTQFTDLPLVKEDEVYEIHRRADLYFLSQSKLTAHSDVGCTEVDSARDDKRLTGNPRWRRATSAEVRDLGGGWCTRCAT